MQIAIVGVGGVGGYFGARLAQAGAAVTFVARGATLHALRTAGLSIESINGDAHLPQVRATDIIAEVGPVDMVLVTVKSWQVPEVAPTLAPLLGPTTGVLPLLNGVEAADQLAAALGTAHVLDGVCYISAFIDAPGRIKHVAIPPRIVFGERDNRASPRVAQLSALLHEAGVIAEVPPDIAAAIWSKFVFITATSGLGAVTRAPMGLLRDHPTTGPLFEQAMRETLAVGQARGVAIGEPAIEAALATLRSLPYGTTASMQRDIMAGRPSELEAQNGAVVRLGEAAGVATPLHRFIYQALLPQELTARGLAQTST
jgi:2-dehydropantoate 2-reductase